MGNRKLDDLVQFSDDLLQVYLENTHQTNGLDASFVEQNVAVTQLINENMEILKQLETYQVKDIAKGLILEDDSNNNDDKLEIEASTSLNKIEKLAIEYLDNIEKFEAESSNRLDRMDTSAIKKFRTAGYKVAATLVGALCELVGGILHLGAGIVLGSLCCILAIPAGIELGVRTLINRKPLEFNDDMLHLEEDSYKPQKHLSNKGLVLVFNKMFDLLKSVGESIKKNRGWHGGWDTIMTIAAQKLGDGSLDNLNYRVEKEKTIKKHHKGSEKLLSKMQLDIMNERHHEANPRKKFKEHLKKEVVKRNLNRSGL